MKQAALDLGEASAPEQDLTKTTLDMPEGLPEYFPDDLDGLKRLAVRFCRAFANCRTTEALKRHGKHYTDTLAIYRQRGIAVAVAWRAFADAVQAKDGPLFGAQSKTSLSYLPGNRTRRPNPARVDSCGCPLPAGVMMPRLEPGMTAHFDGEEWIYGNDCDPR